MLSRTGRPSYQKLTREDLIVRRSGFFDHVICMEGYKITTKYYLIWLGFVYLVCFFTYYPTLQSSQPVLTSVPARYNIWLAWSFIRGSPLPGWAPGWILHQGSTAQGVARCSALPLWVKKIPQNKTLKGTQTSSQQNTCLSHLFVYYFTFNIFWFGAFGVTLKSTQMCLLSSYKPVNTQIHPIFPSVSV